MMHLLSSGSGTMWTVMSDQIKTYPPNQPIYFQSCSGLGSSIWALIICVLALQILREKWKEDSHPLATSLIKFTVISIHYLPLQSSIVSCILLKAVLANEWIH